MAGWDDFLKLLNSHWSGSNPNYSLQPTGESSLERMLSELGRDTFSNYSKLNDLNQQNEKAGTTGLASLGGALNNPMSIADQLQQQLNGIHVSTTPLDQLQKQANATVSAQYDPQINALLRDMGSTKSRAKNNEKEATGMYNALAQDFVNQLPAVQQQMKSEQNDTLARYNDAKTSLQNQYNQQKQDQQNVLQQLGVQAAAPDANRQMDTDQSYFQQQNQLSQNQALDQIMAQGNTDENYTRDMANTSKLAGTNAAQDIASQLEAYLQNAGGQLSDLKGAKANSIASLVQQLQQQDQQSAQSSYNNQFNQMMQLNNLQRNLTNDQNSNQLDQMKLALQMQQLNGSQNQDLFKGTSGMSGMSNYLAQAYPNNPQMASALASLDASVLSNSDVEMGSRQNGLNSAPITNEYLIQLLRNNAKQMGIQDPNAINNAIDALLAYKGQLR